MGILRLLRLPHAMAQWVQTDTMVTHTIDSQTSEMVLLPQQNHEDVDIAEPVPQNNTLPEAPSIVSSPTIAQSPGAPRSRQDYEPQSGSQELFLGTAKTSTEHTVPPPQSRAIGLCNSAFSRLLPDSSSRMVFYGIPAASACWSSEEYEERFRFVKGELIRAVAEHGQLRSSSRYINYSLRMIGTSVDTATACILIECRRCDLKSLRDLFHSHATDRLYCRKDSTLDKLFNNQMKTPKPPFRLVFLPTTQNPLRRYASHADYEAAISHNVSTQTLCGASVDHHGRTATVGLVLEIDGAPRLITVKHLFDNCVDDEDDRVDSEDDYIDDEDEHVGGEDAYSWASPSVFSQPLDDIGGVTSIVMHLDGHEIERHGHLVEMSKNIRQPHQNNNLWAYMHHMTRQRAIHLTNNDMQVRTVEPLGLLQTNSPDLDWTILELDHYLSRSQLLNFIFPTTSEAPILIQSVANLPRNNAAPVYVVSGKEGLRKGHLFRGVTFLGPEAGRKPCGVWTMLLESSQGLIPGECGSIVVDQQTFEAYGHVIGSNILDEVYVVPLTQTVKQIQESFNATSVCLFKLKLSTLVDNDYNGLDNHLAHGIIHTTIYWGVLFLKVLAKLFGSLSFIVGLFTILTASSILSGGQG